MTTPGLIRMRVKDVMNRWRPGSFDPPWTWDDEARDVAERGCCRSRECDNPQHLAPGAYQAGVVARIQREGIGFADSCGAPILAGNDGRIWDGHHRLVAARALGIEWVSIDVAATP